MNILTCTSMIDSTLVPTLRLPTLWLAQSLSFVFIARTYPLVTLGPPRYDLCKCRRTDAQRHGADDEATVGKWTLTSGTTNRSLNEDCGRAGLDRPRSRCLRSSVIESLHLSNTNLHYHIAIKATRSIHAISATQSPRPPRIYQILFSPF